MQIFFYSTFFLKKTIIYKKNPHLRLFDANADLIIVWKN